MLDNSPESRNTITACFLIEKMRSELKDVPTLSSVQLTQWHSQNELRLGLLLQYAEQARVHQGSYERIRNSVCKLHKPLTGAVAISADDIGRIATLLDDIDNNGFCCWMI